jgi:uncharacterized DUF497 family protein
MGLVVGFEWDAEKARANLRKHGVDLADAVVVFEDDHALTMRDEMTAVDEQRYLTMGTDTRGRLLVVAYTWRASCIRVFSAQRATAAERRQYLAVRR